MALQTYIDVNIRAASTTALDLSISRAASLNKLFSDELSSGVVADAADVCYADEFTLAGSASSVLDLQGSMTDIQGAAFLPAKIKLIYVEADSANNIANNLHLISTASTGVPFLLAVGDGIVIKPGGFALLYAPTLAGLASVTATTADNITLTNGAATNTITGRIVIIGCSA